MNHGEGTVYEEEEGDARDDAAGVRGRGPGGRGVVAARPAFLRGQNLNSKLNIAVIGVGGRGGANISGVKSGENIVALCDVNERDARRGRAPSIRRRSKFTDFRQLFDHARRVRRRRRQHLRAHARLRHAAGPAARQARLLREAADAQHLGGAASSARRPPRPKVATQMGTQIHATRQLPPRRRADPEPARSARSARRTSGSSRAWGWQSAEDAKQTRRHRLRRTTGPRKPTPVPPGLDWDLWLGPAPARPFNNVYFPGPKWYRWWDFGNGTMCDLGSHWNDLPFWALKLQAPLTIEAQRPAAAPGARPGLDAARPTSTARAATCRAVKLTWYQGDEQAGDLDRQAAFPQWDNGCLFIGDKGMLLSDYGKHVLLPEEGVRRLQAARSRTIPKSLGPPRRMDPRLQDRRADDVQLRVLRLADRGEPPGQRRLPRRQEDQWDAAAMRATNAPEADKFIRREYRKGWEGILGA